MRILRRLQDALLAPSQHQAIDRKALLAQLVERGSDKAKVVSSSLAQSTFPFCLVHTPNPLFLLRLCTHFLFVGFAMAHHEGLSRPSLIQCGIKHAHFCYQGMIHPVCRGGFSFFFPLRIGAQNLTDKNHSLHLTGSCLQLSGAVPGKLPFPAISP